MPTRESKDPFLPARIEAEARPIRVTKLEIINGSTSSKIGSPGALTVFITKKGSGVLDDVRAAAMGNSDSAKRLLERYNGPQTTKQEKTFSDDAFVKMLIQAPVFADIRYGGDVLNRGIFLPEGADLVTAIFPYNGGRLASGGCTLAEYYQEGTDAALEGLVVQIQPPLTAAERAALNKVPADQRLQNVGSSITCEHTTYWAAAGVGFGVGIGLTTIGVTMTVAAVQLKQESEHLSDEDLAQLDPSASARKLLATRRELLLKHFS